MSPPYAAPERWRAERATIAADVYALGVIAVEMLSGQRPFPGPGVEDYREQHLHVGLGRLDLGQPRLAPLLEECLYKAPGARPSPANLLARLESAAGKPESPGASHLGRVHQAEVAHQGNQRLAASRDQTELERRQELYAAARSSFTGIAREFLNVVEREAPSVDVLPALDVPSGVLFGDGWMAKLRQATLSLGGPHLVTSAPWGDPQCPAFDLIAYGEVKVVHLPYGPWMRDFGHAERSHSLYFCDAVVAGTYTWFETAFMLSPLVTHRASSAPCALGPGAEAARALCAGMTDYQVAWPFTPLVVDDLGEFMDRWVGWFADAVEGRLERSSHLPERPEPLGRGRPSCRTDRPVEHPSPS